MSSSAEQTLLIKSVPSWVRRSNINLEKANLDQYHWLEVNNQFLDNENSRLRYKSRFVHIRNENELDDFQNIQLDFNQSYQHLSFHDFYIIRSGENIDLKHTLDTAEVYRREKRLDAKILDGFYTANIIIPDLRIGDLLHYSYSLDGVNPIYNDFRRVILSLEYSIPVYKYMLVCNWNRQDELLYKQVGPENQSTTYPVKIEKDQSGRVQSLAWELDDPSAKKWVDNVPKNYIYYAEAHYANKKTWKDVIDWGLKLYHIDQNMVDAVSILKEQLKADDDKQSIKNALNYVQENIRYYSIAVNEGTHKPRNPVEILETKYGDCKDMTMLFLTLLKAINIKNLKACPFFISTESYEDLSNYYPSPLEFDHVLVKLEYEGRTYFLDPTYSMQDHDLDHIPQPRYFDYGLAVDANYNDLEKIDTKNKTINLYIDVRYDLSEGPNKPIKLEVKEKRHYFFASNIRHNLKDKENHDDYYENLTAYYRKDIPNIKKLGFDVEDNIKTNTIITTEKYELPSDFWVKSDDNTYKVDLNSIELYSKIAKPNLKDRLDLPLDISSALDLSYRIQVQLDRVLDYENSGKEDKNKYWTYFFDKTIDKENKLLVGEMKMIHHQNSIPASEVQTYYNTIDELEYTMGYQIRLSKDKGQVGTISNKVAVFALIIIIGRLVLGLLRII